jgi:hypothetical protein
MARRRDFDPQGGELAARLPRRGRPERRETLETLAARRFRVAATLTVSMLVVYFGSSHRRRARDSDRPLPRRGAARMAAAFGTIAVVVF